MSVWDSLRFPQALGPDCSCATRPRIYVDCTQTLAHPLAAGIPRVVRNIVRHGAVAAAARGATLVPVQFRWGRFVSVPTGPEGLPQQPVSEHPLADRLRKLLVPHAVVRRMASRAARLLNHPPASAGIEFGSPDVLLLPDSSWGENFWEAIDEAREAGARLGVIQHDFIPVRHPEFVPPAIKAAFHRWIRASLTRADFVVAVSETVARETRAELLALGRAEVAKRYVATCRNGSDFCATPPPRVNGSPVRRSLLRFLEDGLAAPFLTVGTLEPRKNQGLVIEAFDRLHAVDPEVRLLVMGMVGWRGGPVAAAMRRHPSWGKGLLHVGDASDAELLHAYRNSRALVFPSLAEGYGLPIVEALAAGLPVFASDIPVHREVGGSHCTYFDPRRPDDLAARLWEFCGNVSRLRGRVRPDRLPTWKAAAEQIVANALSHVETVPPPRFAVTRLQASHPK